jgi:hypothetical protein
LFTSVYDQLNVSRAVLCRDQATNNMNLPDPGTLATIRSLSFPDSRLNGRKFRIAGRMVSYDSSTALLLVQDGAAAVLVDTTLCLHATSEWVRESGSILLVVGYLDQVEVSELLQKQIKLMHPYIPPEPLADATSPLQCSPSRNIQSPHLAEGFDHHTQA